MKDRRVWHVVGANEGVDDHRLLKRFAAVATVAVAAGFFLSFAYSKWSGQPALTSALAREAPDSADGGDTADVDEPTAASATAHDTTDAITGDWNFTTHVRSATRKEFEGLTLAYRIQLKQDDTRVTGKGQKVSENGKALRGGQRTAITIDGERERDRIMLKFTERGSRRASGGTFFLRLEENALRGTFTSDAAGSKGEVTAERVREEAAKEPKQKNRAR